MTELGSETRQARRQTAREGGHAGADRPGVRAVALRDRLRAELGEERYGRYFGQGARLDVSERAVEVVAPSPFMAQVLDRRVVPMLRRAAVENGGLEVRVRVDRPAAPALPSPAPARRPAPPSGRGAHGATAGYHRLDRFLVGQSNRLAHSAAVRIAEGLDDAGLSPLFVHGPSGVGKTHLLQGVARRVAERTPGAKVRYTTAEAFTNEFIQAINSRTMDKFRRAWRGVRLLCLDDVHFLRAKEGTQQELLHTLDAIGLREARIVMASDEHPRRIAKLSGQLVSRFLAGAVVRIEPPDPDLCRRLAADLASRRGLALAPDGVEALVHRACENPRRSVRDIEGLVTQIGAVRSLLSDPLATDGPIGAEGVRRALGAGETAACADPTDRRPVRFEAIERVVCEQMRVSRADLTGPGRHRRVVLARGLIVRLARELTTLSYPDIIRAMGRRNHSTAITAFHRIGRQIEAGEQASCGPDTAGLTVGDLLERARASLAGARTRYAAH